MRGYQSLSRRPAYHSTGVHGGVRIGRMSPDKLPVLPTVDKRRTQVPAPDPEAVARLQSATAELRRLADIARNLPTVVTVHERYGQPPGDLAYTPIEAWTPQQVAIGQAWLRNEMAKDWWHAQAAAAQ
ncbi:hypothetical protein SEA_TRES_68 [Mycobacterium phage Tres]|uniref:Uncharacterized protein n=12 Tax=Rosebushvirus TaxID=1982900 RepID=A0A0Y0DAX5_9CAUD|nr:gp67 [Mycobacterium phage Rosebush]YP_009616403.1 hypothetical protein FDI79_gp69 [Mycobacterium phage Godines]AER48690.1 hypothetical protein ARES_68 [Mycobacterium phage Ares]ALF01353.1 hypothetical protein SEA_TRES_68 [Mycobacterium phage Tres]AMB17383.1 hypothetical protein SEA_GLASS_69 [Mycobacterium phage Glass]AUX82275.1 hypothetical protein SEA_ITSYBITSY1_67 [Mycobacterium phage ItsyBitsy1]AVO21915.1 hypothetical protein SEA_KHETH_68 [Mycobacterium phage Kheth]AXH69096.1 hypotheti